MNEEKLKEEIKTNKNKTLLGEFKNGYGEKYIIYKENNINWISGDETDWTPIDLANNNFLFSNYETSEIDRILNQITI